VLLGVEGGYLHVAGPGFPGLAREDAGEHAVRRRHDGPFRAFEARGRRRSTDRSSFPLGATGPRKCRDPHPPEAEVCARPVSALLAASRWRVTMSAVKPSVLLAAGRERVCGPDHRCPSRHPPRQRPFLHYQFDLIEAADWMRRIFWWLSARPRPGRPRDRYGNLPCITCRRRNAGHRRAIGNACRGMQCPAVVTNGTSSPISTLARCWRSIEPRRRRTLVLTRVKDPRRYGVVATGATAGS